MVTAEQETKPKNHIGSDRRRQVHAMFESGMTRKEIATELGISYQRVRQQLLTPNPPAPEPAPEQASF